MCNGKICRSYRFIVNRQKLELTHAEERQLGDGRHTRRPAANRSSRAKEAAGDKPPTPMCNVPESDSRIGHHVILSGIFWVYIARHGWAGCGVSSNTCFSVHSRAMHAHTRATWVRGMSVHASHLSLNVYTSMKAISRIMDQAYQGLGSFGLSYQAILREVFSGRLNCVALHQSRSVDLNSTITA